MYRSAVFKPLYNENTREWGLDVLGKFQPVAKGGTVRIKTWNEHLPVKLVPVVAGREGIPPNFFLHDMDVSGGSKNWSHLRYQPHYAYLFQEDDDENVMRFGPILWSNEDEDEDRLTSSSPDSPKLMTWVLRDLNELKIILRKLKEYRQAGYYDED